MPRLLIFAPCEKVLISIDNAVSLINTLFGGHITAHIPSGQSRDAPLSIPMNWSIFCLWEKQDEDEGKEYEQSIRMVYPNGHVTFDRPQSLIMDKMLHRTISTSTSFPVAEAGKYNLLLMLKDRGSDGEPEEKASCSITVSHVGGDAGQ